MELCFKNISKDLRFRKKGVFKLIILQSFKQGTLFPYRKPSLKRPRRCFFGKSLKKALLKNCGNFHRLPNLILLGNCTNLTLSISDRNKNTEKITPNMLIENKNLNLLDFRMFFLMLHNVFR